MCLEGIIIEPEEIKRQSDEMVTALQSDYTGLQSALASIGGFQAENSLQGLAWNKLKEGGDDWRLICQGLICAGDAMTDDCIRLKNMVGEEAFYGDAVSAAITFQNGMIDIYEQRIASLKQSRRWLGLLGMPVRWVDRAINTAEEVIRSCQNLIAEYRMRIEQAQWIINSTGNLFQYAQALYASVEQGIAELEQGGTNASCSGLSGWRQALGGAWEKRMQEIEVTSRRFLNDAGFTEHQLQTAAELGYSYEEVKNLWIQFGDTQDRQFFQYLMDGNVEGYEAAFQMNPMELSDAMTLVLADYAYRLLQAEKIQSLTEFNNAVLSADHMITDENGTVLSINYADKYLERLVLGSSMQVQGDLVCVAAVNPADDTEAYHALYEMYEKKFALMSLWTTESAVIQQLKRQEFNEAIAMSVDALEIDGMNLSFRLNHLSHGEMVAEEVEISYIGSGSGLSRMWNIQKLKQMKEDRENVLGKGIISILQGTGLTVLGILAPESAIFASMVLMLLEGEPKEITELDSLVETQLGKLGVSSANTTVSSIINTYFSYLKAERELEAEEYRQAMEWFGAGARYEVKGGSLMGEQELVICGLYNPRTLYRIREWNENGVRGWTTWDEKTSELIEKAINEADEDENEKQNALRLLNGSLGSGEELNVCAMDMEEFQLAMQLIEQIAGREGICNERGWRIEEGEIYSMWNDVNRGL